MRGNQGTIEEVLYVQELTNYVYVIKVKDLRFASFREEHLKFLDKDITKTPTEIKLEK